MIEYIIIFLAEEIIALPIFYFTLKYFRKNNQVSSGFSFISVLKGLLERLMIYIGLLNDLPHILTVFAALKVATRLEGANKEKISNDYFLTGNIISILLAIIAYLFCKPYFAN